MTVPFVDLKRLHAPLRPELMAAVERVLESGHYVQGHEVARLEEEFASALGAEHAVAVNSGTAALHLALAASGIGPGDEVILPANTFIATAEAVTLAGAVPVLVDIDLDTMNIDPAAVAAAVTQRTRAIIAVHLYGRIAPMRELRALADRYSLLLIEDACQAHGAMQDGKYAGTIGDIGCFSFYPTKNLGTVGEGGMLITPRRATASTAASLREHGQSTRYYHSLPGYNYRLPEIQAAMLRVMLPSLMGWNARRVSSACAYNDALEAADLTVPFPAPVGQHVYHLYVVRTPDREKLKEHLEARGIGVAVHYPVPIHLQAAYATCGLGPGDLPNAERASREILSLPMHPALTAGEIATVADGVAAFDALKTVAGR